MQEFSSETLKKLLFSATITQESIIETSKQIFNYAQQKAEVIPNIVNDWTEVLEQTLKEISEGKQNQQRLLALFYILNEIIYKCGVEKCGQFKQLFEGNLSKIFTNCFEIMKLDQKFLNSVRKMVEVWEQKNIFGKEQLALLKPQQLKYPNQEGLPEGLPQVPTLLRQFASSKRDLSKWTEKSTGYKEKGEGQGQVNDNIEEELKQSIELEQKYRMNSLKAGIELLKNVDAKHLKYVIELKKLCQMEKMIEEFEAQF